MTTKPKILIVDDDQDIRESLQDLLYKDFELEVVEDGEKALDVLSKKSFDLILLDIMMPKLDGFETCKRLQKDPKAKDIPIIFLTAKTETDNLVKGFELGAVDYLTKPFTAAELLSRVKSHLELKEKSDSLKISNLNYRELIHVLCHDLANPISFMYGVLQLGEKDPSVFRQLNKEMWTAVNSSIEIIDLVKKMRALEEGKTTLELKSVYLKKCFDDSIDILKSKLDEKSITLECNIDENIRVLVEKTSFGNSVLNNLITNAIKFSNKDSKIIVNASQQDNKVTISIKDFGIGMPQDLLKNVFNIHEATTRSGTNGETGTGFGMPLVQKFIVAYGGEIEIFSEEKSSNTPNQGTEVKLTLKGAMGLFK